MTTTVPGSDRLAAYLTRNVRPLGVDEIEDHSVKLYALEAQGRTVDHLTVEAAIPTIASALNLRDERFHEHLLGFAILHAGEDALWLLVDRWIDGAILCHRLFSTDRDLTGPFSDRSGGDLCFCVWEGEIVDFERRAFRETMMRDKPDPARYLQTTLSGPV